MSKQLLNSMYVDIAMVVKGQYGNFTDTVEAVRRVIALHQLSTIESFQLQYALHWILESFFSGESAIIRQEYLVTILYREIVDENLLMRKLLQQADPGVLTRTIESLLNQIRLTQVYDGERLLRSNMVGEPCPTIRDVLKDLQPRVTGID